MVSILKDSKLLRADGPAHALAIALVLAAVGGCVEERGSDLGQLAAKHSNLPAVHVEVAEMTPVTKVAIWLDRDDGIVKISLRDIKVDGRQPIGSRSVMIFPRNALDWKPRELEFPAIASTKAHRFSLSNDIVWNDGFSISGTASGPTE